MCTSDELPRRGKGRPMKVTAENPFEPIPGARTDTARCRECPKLAMGWCPVSARQKSGAEPMCRYGLTLRRAAKVAARRAAAAAGFPGRACGPAVGKEQKESK